MTITRSEIIKMLSEKTGYYQKDIGPLLKAYDELVLELLDGVDEDNSILIQLVQGVRIGANIVPPRDRVDPRDGSPIHLGATVKPFAKFSDDFKLEIQKQYDNKKLEDS